MLFRSELAPIAADHSFNCISVEGHTSTNDSLIFLANGAGPKLKGGALNVWRENAVEVWQDDGARVRQFRISNVDQMMSFDCGELELK